MYRRATLKKIDKYLEWYSTLSWEEAKRIKAETIEQIHKYKERGKSYNTPAEMSCCDAFEVKSWSSYPESNRPENKFPIQRDAYLKKYQKFKEYTECFEQPVNVGEWHDGEYAYLYLGNPEKGIIVLHPEKYLELVPQRDYSSMTPNQVRMALGQPEAPLSDVSIVPAEYQTAMSPTMAKEKLDHQRNRLSDLEAEIDGVKRAETGELAEMKAQIEKMQKELAQKKENMMAELSKKKAEMEAVKERLEMQIYLLDSQIYAIECYAGETVKFAKLRSGKDAPISSPLVIHQKVRYLDEELGRLASIYSIAWEDTDLFECFLKNSPLAIDTFAPNERCVVLVRLSKNNKILARGDTLEYVNMLDSYEYYHGATVGIIIRNGENLYFGWSDEDRVHIEDDLIVSQVITTEEPAKDMPSWEHDEFVKKQKAERKSILDGVMSRSFIYNILQGVVDHTNIMPLPEGARLDTPSQYVVYSVADKWIDDNRFGGFDAIVERCNSNVSKGDMLLTVQYLVPEHNRGWGSNSYTAADRPWDNSRGRGEANRTHDCSVEDCTLYLANLVEYDEPVAMKRYRYNPYEDPVSGEKKWRIATVLEDTELSDDAEVVEHFKKRERHVFVSVKKTDDWRYGNGYNAPDKEPRANFELYEKEYINLTYLNSVWLESVITNKKLGGWSVGGKAVDYAYAIRYLKTALDFVRKREQKEEIVILEALQEVSNKTRLKAEWQVALSEWKLLNKIRQINSFQAKRFVRYLAD